MKVRYDAEVDALYIRFNDAQIMESDEVEPGVILDYDATGNLVGMELLNASKRVDNPRAVELAVSS